MPTKTSRTVCPDVDDAVREAMRAVYARLENLSHEERLVWILHHLEGHELRALPALTGLSYSTARRRLACAREKFSKAAEADERLAPWLETTSERTGTLEGEMKS